MRLLPSNLRTADVEVIEDGKLMLIVSLYVDKNNVRKFVGLEFSEFSETLTCVKDLEHIVAEALNKRIVDGTTILDDD